MSDLISRQEAVKEVKELFEMGDCYCDKFSIVGMLNSLPSVQPTLHGYNIEHLEMIARVLQKEDLPPERIVEALTDMSRIVAIVKDEFEEILRRAMDQWTT